MDLTLSVNIYNINDTCQFEPKSKWNAATPYILSLYKYKLHSMSDDIFIPTDVLLCTDFNCSIHTNVIDVS